MADVSISKFTQLIRLQGQASVPSLPPSTEDTPPAVNPPGSGGLTGVNQFIQLTDTPATYSGATLNYARVNAGETGLEFRTPAQALADIGAVPTTRTITINGNTQDLSSNRTWTIPTHDPVTIGTANGLSLVGQQLSLGLASSGVTGALSGTDWDTFNGKIGGTISSGQVAFGTGVGVIGGDSGFTWDNVNSELNLLDVTTDPKIILTSSGSGGVGNPQIILKRSTLVGLKLEYFPNVEGRISAISSSTAFLSFYTGLGTNESWRIEANGNLRSFGTKSINSSSAWLLLQSGGLPVGIGNITPTETLDVNGTTKIRTINNGTGDFVTTSATGVLQKRTASEVASDIGAVLTTGNQSIAGVKTFTTQVSVTGTFLSLPTALSDRGKLRIFGASSEWAIGNQGSTTFGRLNNTAITFNVPNTDTQGWWWGDSAHTVSQGAMALTSNGNLTVANSLRLGYGESDTDDTVSYNLDINGTAFFKGSIPLRLANSSGTIRASYSESGGLSVSRDSAFSNILQIFDSDGSTVLFKVSSLGTQIGTSASHDLSFYGETPISQPTTAIAEAAFVANSGTAINDNSTFGGYTIQQVVQALQNLGLLA